MKECSAYGQPRRRIEMKQCSAYGQPRRKIEMKQCSAHSQAQNLDTVAAIPLDVDYPESYEPVGVKDGIYEPIPGES